MWVEIRFGTLTIQQTTRADVGQIRYDVEPSSFATCMGKESRHERHKKSEQVVGSHRTGVEQIPCWQVTS